MIEYMKTLDFNNDQMNKVIYAEDVLNTVKLLDRNWQGESEDKWMGMLILASMLLNISIDQILEIIGGY